MLSDPSVSGRHARLTWHGAALLVEDLGSANGTWVRGQRIILEKNPNWRGGTWDFKANPDEPYDELIVKQMKGKPLAQIDRVEIYPIEEEQSRWLAFKNKQLDFINIPQSFIKQALPGGKVAPDLAAEGARVATTVDPEYTYNYFQWNDPIWGGSELHKVALRRAVAMAINRGDEIDIIRKGTAKRAEFIVPEGVVGHQAGYKSGIDYNPALANALFAATGVRIRQLPIKTQAGQGSAKKDA